jgi:hypothetical protein
VIVGVGLSHWVDVRIGKSNDRRVFLADISESCLGVEHVADRIILAAEPDSGDATDPTLRLTVFDALSLNGQAVLLPSRVMAYDNASAPSSVDTKDESRLHEMALRDEARRKYEEDITRFEGLVRMHGAVMLDACNGAIREVWERKRPVLASGPRRGELHPLPHLARDGDDVVLHTGLAAQGGRVKIRTPLARSSGGAGQHHLRNSVWREDVVPAIAAVIERFAAHQDA